MAGIRGFAITAGITDLTAGDNSCSASLLGQVSAVGAGVYIQYVSSRDFDKVKIFERWSAANRELLLEQNS